MTDVVKKKRVVSETLFVTTRPIAEQLLSRLKLDSRQKAETLRLLDERANIEWAKTGMTENKKIPRAIAHSIVKKLFYDLSLYRSPTFNPELTEVEAKQLEDARNGLHSLFLMMEKWTERPSRKPEEIALSPEIVRLAERVNNWYLKRVLGPKRFQSFIKAFQKTIQLAKG